MTEMIRIRFSEIERAVPDKPGIYEIYTVDGLALKVGIGKDLRKRLIQHRKSRQNRLVLKIGGDWDNPSDVTSKQSILAKHLYFSSPVEGYDLKTETGRQAFLEECCYVLFRVTSTREEARAIERQREADGGFSYVGRAGKHRE
ncbi:hypothetical protein [Pseudomonas akapageensis]|uniref:hypothetical protein n=1 Tax=Pseudomonas akapageensis TaxID=2609961 RepID=UPI00140BAA67|nr:hypothetical protein [Pseudomonas akapageensis]